MICTNILIYASVKRLLGNSLRHVYLGITEKFSYAEQKTFPVKDASDHIYLVVDCSRENREKEHPTRTDVQEHGKQNTPSGGAQDRLRQASNDQTYSLMP